MSLHVDLLKQARLLATREPRRPLQASLRRSVSAGYYALFHLFVFKATGRFIKGADRTALRHCLARAFAHAEMKEVSRQFALNNVSAKIQPGLNGLALPSELRRLATTFVDLQQARHEADYDPARKFTRSEVLDLVGRVEQAFKDWSTIKNGLQADVFLTGLLAQRSMKR